MSGVCGIPEVFLPYVHFLAMTREEIIIPWSCHRRQRRLEFKVARLPLLHHDQCTASPAAPGFSRRKCFIPHRDRFLRFCARRDLYGTPSQRHACAFSPRGLARSVEVSFSVGGGGGGGCQRWIDAPPTIFYSALHGRRRRRRRKGRSAWKARRLKIRHVKVFNQRKTV